MEDAFRQMIREELAKMLEQMAPRLAAELAEKMGKHGGPESYYSTERAAEIADVGPDTIRQWVKDGLLQRCGPGQLRVKASDLCAVMERRKLRAMTSPGDIDSKVHELAARLRR